MLPLGDNIMRAAGFEPNVVRRYCTVLCNDSLYSDDKLLVFKVAVQEDKSVVWSHPTR